MVVDTLMSGIEILPLVTRDLKRIVEIEKESFPEPWSMTVLRSEIEAGESRRYTKAVFDGELVGYLGLMFVDDEVHINTLAVVAEHRQHGIASRLLLDGIDAGLDRGARHATLEVAVSNAAAQALYRSFGLAPVGLRRGYYAKGEDAMVMWARDLDAPQEVTRRTAIKESLG